MRAIRGHPRNDYDDDDGGPPRLARLRRALSTAVGAAVALAMLVALGIWFYRLGARDAENVPIIRASAEPTKSRPDEPGGAVAPYQEITSYGVAESGEPAPAITATVIAPPPPEPRQEDAAMGTLAPDPAERAGAEATALDPDGSTPVTVRVIDEESGPATVRLITEETVPITAAPSPGTADADAAEDITEVPGAAGAVDEAGETIAEADEIAALVRQATLDAATSPKPKPTAPPPNTEEQHFVPLPPARPSDLRARIEASVRAAEANAAELTRQAAASPVQIQLAADPDEQVVRATWRRIAEANSDLLHDRELAVQPTVSGGTTYYRLRVGPFAGQSEARAVCQALKARGQDCVVARNG